MTRRFQNLGIAKIGLTSISIAKKSSKHRVFLSEFLFLIRVAELGNLSSGAKKAMKIFVKRVFTRAGNLCTREYSRLFVPRF